MHFLHIHGFHIHWGGGCVKLIAYVYGSMPACKPEVCANNEKRWFSTTSGPVLLMNTPNHFYSKQTHDCNRAKPWWDTRHRTAGIVFKLLGQCSKPYCNTGMHTMNIYLMGKNQISQQHLATFAFYFSNKLGSNPKKILKTGIFRQMWYWKETSPMPAFLGEGSMTIGGSERGLRDGAARLHHSTCWIRPMDWGLEAAALTHYGHVNQSAPTCNLVCAQICHFWEPMPWQGATSNG